MKKFIKILIGVPLLIIGALVLIINMDFDFYDNFMARAFIGMVLVSIGVYILASVLPEKYRPSRPDPGGSF